MEKFMSQIARVFVVLNLVLAAGFLFAAGTFLGVKADWVAKYQAEKEAHNKDNTANSQTITQLNAQIQDLTAQNNALKESKSGLESTAAQQKTTIETLQAELSTKNTQIAGLTNDVASATDAVKRGQDEIKRLGDKNVELTAAVAAAQKAEQEAKAAETTAKATIVERDNSIAGLEADKKKLEDLNHEKALIIEWARNQGVDIAKAIKMEPINDARVVAFDSGMKLVQFNVGSKVGVAKGYVIDVVRGTNYIGRVRIDQVYGDHCAGTLEVAAPGQSPMVGDRGTNTL
jgi:predicted  nucleic acid-binding Zn-ribbon protein